MKAKNTKKSKKVILIQTNEIGLFDEKVNFEGMIILQAPSLQIAKCLSKKELTKPSARTAKSGAAFATLQPHHF
jgi:hypothetical protein